MSRAQKIISWICRIVVAVIFLQTVFLFKFTGAEESKYIFTTVMGAEYEAIGRIGSGIAELIASILILLPQTVPYGAILSIGAISGAIFSHLFTKLGIVVMDDGGALFGLAVLILILSAVVLILHRRELPIIGEAS